MHWNIIRSKCFFSYRSYSAKWAGICVYLFTHRLFPVFFNFNLRLVLPSAVCTQILLFPFVLVTCLFVTSSFLCTYFVV
jgi:hypothetical protein